MMIDSGGGTDYVSGTGVSSIVKDTWKVIAHEIGHGFGIFHESLTSLNDVNRSSA